MFLKRRCLSLLFTRIVEQILRMRARAHVRHRCGIITSRRCGARLFGCRRGGGGSSSATSRPRWEESTLQAANEIEEWLRGATNGD